MKVLIEAPFNLTDQIKSGIENTVRELAVFQPKMTQGAVYFKMDDGNVPDAVTAEVQLHVPGPVIFASANAEQFMDAFQQAASKAERQLRKAKDMRVEHR